VLQYFPHGECNLGICGPGHIMGEGGERPRHMTGHTYLHSIDNHSATRFEELVYLYHDISTRRVDDRIEL